MTAIGRRATRWGSGLLRAALAIPLMLAIGGVAVWQIEAALAHGNPEIKVEPNPAPFGGEVTIEGEEFDEDLQISLVLEGISGEVSLGTATTDSEGKFSLTVTLPAAVTAGGYQIKAVGPDEVATADLRVGTSEGGTSPSAEHEASVGFRRVDSAGEVAGLAALAAVMTVLGVLLVRLPGREHRA